MADGIGGLAGGETASRIAVEKLQEVVAEQALHPKKETPFSPAVALKVLLDGFAEANRAVREAASHDTELRGMGTTMTALLLLGKEALLAHLGDSRAYLFRQNRLEQLTEDHSLVAARMSAGLLTRTEARTSPVRHIITKAIGIEAHGEPEAKTLEVKTGDIFLLCTDGLTEMMPDEEIERLMQITPFAEMTDMLIKSANSAGGVDNITSVTIQIEK